MLSRREGSASVFRARAPLRLQASARLASPPPRDGTCPLAFGLTCWNSVRFQAGPRRELCLPGCFTGILNSTCPNLTPTTPVRNRTRNPPNLALEAQSARYLPHQPQETVSKAMKSLQRGALDNHRHRWNVKRSTKAPASG